MFVTEDLRWLDDPVTELDKQPNQLYLAESIPQPLTC
jgi:hypothetical protein